MEAPVISGGSPSSSGIHPVASHVITAAVAGSIGVAATALWMTHKNSNN